MQNLDIYKFYMIQQVYLAFLTGYTEVETRPGVSNQLCHAEPQDAGNVRKYLLYLRSSLNFYFIFV